mgnify:CR=1 FL=1
MHRSQIFFYILLSFILGIFAGSFFDISKNVVLIAAIVCALLIAVFYRRGSRLLNVRLALVAFLALFFLAGILRFNTVNSKTHNLQKFADAVKATGYSLSEIQEYIQAHAELKTPFYKAPHYKGIVGVAAGFVKHVGERMQKDGMQARAKAA